MLNLHSEYVPVIGLEVHVQLNTKTKLFCACPNESLGSPNSRVCPTCLGHPGTLPVPNKQVLTMATRFGLAMKAKLNNKIQFSRKNYFYPDLPKGYQTSQFSLPICEDGALFFYHNNELMTIRLNRAHLEEDAGKLTHFDKNQYSGIDLNRCGAPLLEIVSEPDIHSPEQARAYLTHLKRTIQFLGISECDMEKGQLRCDANISIKKKADKQLNTRTEIKNLNSFKFVEKALTREYHRQVDVCTSGNEVVQCTLRYNDKTDTLSINRVKEDAHDYRYFPDPDQMPVKIEIKDGLGLVDIEDNLPLKRFEHYISECNLSHQEADRLCQSRDIAEFFDSCMDQLREPKHLSNWITGELAKYLNQSRKTYRDIKYKIPDFIHLLKCVLTGKLTGTLGKAALRMMIIDDSDLGAILNRDEFKGVLSEQELKLMLKEIIKNYPDEMTRFKQGEQKLRGFFIGRAMYEAKGKANPKILKKLLDDIQISTD